MVCERMWYDPVRMSGSNVLLGGYEEMVMVRRKRILS